MRKDPQFAGVALQQAFVDHYWERKVFHPDPQWLHEITRRVVVVTPTRLQRHVGEGAVSQLAIPQLALELFQIQQPQPRALQIQEYQLIAALVLLSFLGTCDLAPRRQPTPQHRQH